MSSFRIKILELDTILIVLCLDYGIVAQQPFSGPGRAPSRGDLAQVFRVLTTDLESLGNPPRKERDIGPVVKHVQKCLAQSKNRHELDIIIFDERNEYRAQGLQIDFLARGETIKELFLNLVRVLSDKKLDDNSKINAASEYFFLKWADMRAAYLGGVSNHSKTQKTTEAVVAA